MTGAELINAVAVGAYLKKKDAELAFQVITEQVFEVLKRGGSVGLPGVGVMSVQRRAARIGRNPRTGDSIRIPAKKQIKFSVSGALDDAINGR